MDSKRSGLSGIQLFLHLSLKGLLSSYGVILCRGGALSCSATLLSTLGTLATNQFIREISALNRNRSWYSLTCTCRYMYMVSVFTRRWVRYIQQSEPQLTYTSALRVDMSMLMLRRHRLPLLRSRVLVLSIHQICQDLTRGSVFRHETGHPPPRSR